MGIMGHKFKMGWFVGVRRGDRKSWQRSLIGVEGNRKPLKRPIENVRDRPLSIHLISRWGNWESGAEVTAQAPPVIPRGSLLSSAEWRLPAWIRLSQELSGWQQRVQDEKLTSGDHLPSRDAPRTIRGSKRKEEFRRELRTKERATGMKETLPNIVWTHVAVGTWDT